MRRTILLGVAVLTLAALSTTPAAAAPEGNPGAVTWHITCEEHGTFDAMSPAIVPGWRLDGTVTPVMVMGGTFYEVVGGEETLLGTDPPPPGLMPKLDECLLEGPTEVDPSVYQFIGRPVYMFFPAT